MNEFVRKDGVEAVDLRAQEREREREGFNFDERERRNWEVVD